MIGHLLSSPSYIFRYTLLDLVSLLNKSSMFRVSSKSSVSPRASDLAHFPSSCKVYFATAVWSNTVSSRAASTYTSPCSAPSRIVPLRVIVSLSTLVPFIDKSICIVGSASPKPSGTTEKYILYFSELFPAWSNTTNSIRIRDSV